MHDEPDSPHGAGHDIGPLATRLNELIEYAQDRESRVYTNKEIAARSTELGYRLSPGHLSHIRVGRVRNPGFRHIEGISLALGIDIREFLDGFASGTTDTHSAALRFPELKTLNAVGRATFAARMRGILAELQNNAVYRNDG